MSAIIIRAFIIVYPDYGVKIIPVRSENKMYYASVKALSAKGGIRSAKRL